MKLTETPGKGSKVREAPFVRQLRRQPSLFMLVLQHGHLVRQHASRRRALSTIFVDTTECIYIHTLPLRRFVAGLVLLFAHSGVVWRALSHIT